MKIVLVSSNQETVPYPVYPVGMSAIAMALKKAGHDVVLCDLLLADSANLESWRATLREHRPGLVGISIRNLDNANLINEKRFTGIVGDLVACVHEELGVPVALGGSGYSLLPELILQQSGADYGVVGEGERSMVELASGIERGDPPPRGTVLRQTPPLDGPAICGAHYDREILADYLRRGSIAPVQTKRGCALKCAYCSYPVLEGGRLRQRPPAEVVDDVRRLIDEHGAKYIFFTDSLFNDDRGNYLNVLREMKRRNVSVPWTAFLKPSGITQETAALMRETGLAAAELGSDGSTDATLRGLRKPFRFKQVQAASEILTSHGIAVAHYFMFGGPGETRQTLQEGIGNIIGLCCSAVFVFLGIRILPHTQLRRVAVAENLISASNDLLKPVYYLSPQIDREWAHETLKRGFAKVMHVIFPPDAMDERIPVLRELGYPGPLWELLGPSGGL